MATNGEVLTRREEADINTVKYIGSTWRIEISIHSIRTPFHLYVRKTKEETRKTT